ncbi:MAG: MFS transporter [Pseudomonadota bacterium]
MNQSNLTRSAGAVGWPLWAIVLSAGTIAAVVVGFRQVTGLYLPPVTQSLNIGVEPFARAMAVANLLWGLGGIFAGALADKFGAGRVIAGGIALMMVGYLFMYFAESGEQLLWSGVFIGVGVAGAGSSVLVGVIGRAASPDKRTAAIASLGMANGIGNFIAFPYTHLLIEALGWRGSIVIVVVTLGVLLPFAFLLSGKPVANVTSKQQTLREACAEAFALRSYWLLILGFFVCGFHIAFYAVHLPKFVATQGLESWVGVVALTGVGVANIIGTYLSGQSAKFVPKRYGLSFIYFSRCFAFIGLLYLPINEITVIGVSIILGLFWLATFPLTSSLVSTFFGTNWLAMLFGIVLFSHQLGAFVGVWLAGILFDMTQSYELMWWISIALALFAALVHLPIKEEGVPRLKIESQPA